MNNKKLIFLICNLLMLSGCYTIMRHSQVERESYLSSEISHRDICSSCHTGFGSFTMEDPYALQEPYNSPRLKKWNDYYHYPWWADSFYYPNRGKNEKGEPLSPVDPRSLSNRKGIDGSGISTMPAPAGAGIRMLTKGSKIDSTKAKEKATPDKPSTNKDKLKKKSKRTKKN